MENFVSSISLTLLFYAGNYKYPKSIPRLESSLSSFCRAYCSILSLTDMLQIPLSEYWSFKESQPQAVKEVCFLPRRARGW